MCDYWNPHPPRNIVVRNCMFINLDATLGRWGRSGDCQVDGGVPVVVSSTAIGAAPEPWQSPQGLIRPYWLVTVSLPPAALCIHTWYAIASSITCFGYPVKWTVFVSVIICWLLLHPLEISVNKILLLLGITIIVLVHSSSSSADVLVTTNPTSDHVDAK